jgi:hypothetical protein
MVMAWWWTFGVRMRTASSSDDSSIASNESKAAGIPHVAATSRVCSGRAPVIARTSASGWCASAGRYMASAHQLVPATPIRTCPVMRRSLSRGGRAASSLPRCPFSGPWGCSEAADPARDVLLRLVARSYAPTCLVGASRRGPHRPPGQPFAKCSCSSIVPLSATDRTSIECGGVIE